jgi:hypothetical protein
MPFLCVRMSRISSGRYQDSSYMRLGLDGRKGSRAPRRTYLCFFSSGRDPRSMYLHRVWSLKTAPVARCEASRSVRLWCVVPRTSQPLHGICRRAQTRSFCARPFATYLRRRTETWSFVRCSGKRVDQRLMLSCEPDRLAREASGPALGAHAGRGRGGAPRACPDVSCRLQTEEAAMSRQPARGLRLPRHRGVLL